MNDQLEGNREVLPAADLSRIDHVCGQFRAAWMSGQRPRIEDFLAAAVDNEGFCVWDMRAIRQRLAPLGLDWNQPPLPAAKARDHQLLQVEIHPGALTTPNDSST